MKKECAVKIWQKIVARVAEKTDSNSVERLLYKIDEKNNKKLIIQNSSIINHWAIAGRFIKSADSVNET